MASKQVPSPSCPKGHVHGQVHAQGERRLKRGLTRRWRCRYLQDGEQRQHFFTTLDADDIAARALLDRAVPKPECPNPDHAGRTVRTNGTYETGDGLRQRYRCMDLDDPEGTRHTFSAPLPRSLVGADTCCEDCKVPTPRHAGTEASTRRLNYPASAIYATLNDLASGQSYAHASMQALERMGRSTGRSRKVGDKEVKELNEKGLVSPQREMKAHWHIAADILERFGPLVTEGTFERIRAEEAEYRKEGWPVVYIADEVPVKRNFSRTSRARQPSPVVWNALVISRMAWQSDGHGNLVGRSSRLVRVRALPSVAREAWQLVMNELDAPDFLVADGAAAIEGAAALVWPNATFVPCLWHATQNIRKRLTPARASLPQKVDDHVYSLSREAMEKRGPSFIGSWFDELEVLADGADMPADAVASIRGQYEPLLTRTAAVAARGVKPVVPISNAGVENEIATWVSHLVNRRGAMFSNLARTNLLGDLIVAGANGALLRQHDVITVIRDTARRNGGWLPPPRALVEPAGAFSLRDPALVAEFLPAE